MQNWIVAVLLVGASAAGSLGDTVNFEGGVVGTPLDVPFIFPNGTLTSQLKVTDLDFGTVQTYTANYVEKDGRTTAGLVGNYFPNLQFMWFQVDFTAPVSDFEMILTSETYSAPGKYWGTDAFGDPFERQFTSLSTVTALGENGFTGDDSWKTEIQAGVGESISGFYVKQGDTAPIALYLHEFSYSTSRPVPEVLNYSWLLILLPFALRAKWPARA
jgi:hypothetical protein